MSIDDVPPALTVDLWRSVLHDAIDEALDQILLSAETAWEQDLDHLDEWDEPPGEPPGGGALPDLTTALRDGLGAALMRGTAFWGCDGTLRCTRAWAEEIVDPADPLLDTYRRQGILCDCAVLETVLGRTDVRPRCPDRPHPPAGRGSWPWS